MGLMETVKHKDKLQLWWELKRNLLRQMESRGHNKDRVDKFGYDPTHLDVEEYRKWWCRSKMKLRDTITREVEPHDEMRPYLAQDGTARVYNIVYLWSGMQYILHPPVKALPKYPELENA